MTQPANREDATASDQREWPRALAWASPREAVQRYYAETLEDYIEYWAGPEDLALHLGHYRSPNDQHATALLHTNEVLASVAGDLSQVAVLDAGCGMGGSSQWLAAQFGCRVTAVNVSVEHLRLAVDALRRAATPPHVHLSAQDFHELGLRDNTFDVVWALESCNHSVSRPLVFSEFSRVLRPGGRMVVAELTLFNSADTLDVATHQTLDTFRRGWALHDILTTQDISAAATRVGFAALEFVDTTAAVAPSVARLEALALEAQARIGERVRSGTWSDTRVANIHASVALGTLLRLGIIGYSVYTATKLSLGGS